jgi:hypothetical protein
MDERILGELKLDHTVTPSWSAQPPPTRPGLISDGPISAGGDPRAPLTDSLSDKRSFAGDDLEGAAPGLAPIHVRRETSRTARRFRFVLLGILALCVILGGVFWFWIKQSQPPAHFSVSKPAELVAPGRELLIPTAIPTPASTANATPGLTANPTPVAPALSPASKPSSIEPAPKYHYRLLRPVAYCLILLVLGLLTWFFVRRLRNPKINSGEERTDSVQASVHVAIGETRCLREESPAEGGLLIADDIKAYAHFHCAFYRLEFSLTMLPDHKRSIERGELSLELLPDNQQAKLPFFVRLHPEQEVVLEKRTLKKSGDGKATFKISPIGEIEAGGSVETGSELQVESVSVTSWGAGEQKGGWLFNATATRSIRTSITGLTALVAIPLGQKARGRFRAAAHLRSVAGWSDRLEPEPEVFVEYEFPPTLDIPSVEAPVPEYV